MLQRSQVALRHVRNVIHSEAIANVSLLQHQSIARRQCSSFPESKYGSNTGSAVLDPSSISENLKDENVPPSRLFPWRDAQELSSVKGVKFGESGILSGILRMISRFNVKMTLYGLRNKEGKLIEFEELKEGAKYAYESAVLGIFRHPLLQAHEATAGNIKAGKPSEESEELAAADATTAEVPGLGQIFGEELAGFYEYAVERHCLDPRHLLHYSLEEIHGSSISEMEFLVGTRRDMDFKDLTMMKFLGLGFMTIGKSFRAKEAGWKALTESMDRRIDMGYATIRITVKIDCTEIFAVTDAVHGTTLQGTLQPRRVTHEVMLEALMFQEHPRGDVEMIEDWTIVDIDYWLEGNHFWAHDKIKPPHPSS
mmetsp:Transcript_7993/g.13286  ORF Transcript_7993/g.13286 Transcript_7993/m.13286 type:complete len:368 (+) Transcript_7993:76-1179(+)